MRMTMSTGSTMTSRVHRKVIRIPSKRHPGKAIPGKLHSMNRVSNTNCCIYLYVFCLFVQVPFSFCYWFEALRVLAKLIGLLVCLPSMHSLVNIETESCCAVYRGG